jgi:hypothetical protein
MKLEERKDYSMLIRAKTIKGYKLHCLDGEIGKVKEFYFDDRHWAIRYLVVDTGNWLASRQVLLSPYALVAASNEEQHFTIALTKKQIEDSPSLDSDKPLSRQFEEAYYVYYGWPVYWGGPHMWGASPHIARGHDKRKGSTHGEKAWNPHLRSTQEVGSYHIQAADGEIGHIVDFIIDDEQWAIRYLIVDTSNWLTGTRVLVSLQWIERISWDESKIFVGLSREAIKRSPEYTDDSSLTREYEIGLHRHYDRRGYWVDEPAHKKHSR